MFDSDDEDGSPGDWREQEEYGEPEEFDPEDVGPEIPEAPDPSDVDVDPELRMRFWSLVLVFNLALLGVSLGVMFIGFEGNWNLGGKLLALGLLLSAFGFYRYRETKATVLGTDEAAGGGESDAAGGSAESGETDGDRNG